MSYTNTNIEALAAVAPTGTATQAAWLPAGAAFSTDYPTTILGTTGLVAYWKLDETSGTSIADATGNSHTGTTHGTPTLNQTGATTPGGASILFTRASSQYISVPTISLANPYSIEVWVKPVTLSTDQTYLCKQGSDWHVLTHSDIARGLGGRNQGIFNGYVSWRAPVVATWYHLVLVMDSAGVSWFWVNGTLEDVRVAGTCPNSSAVLGIGGDTSDGTYADAYIAHAAVYSVALTYAQIRQHAQGAAVSAASGVEAGRMPNNKNVITQSTTSSGRTSYAY